MTSRDVQILIKSPCCQSYSRLVWSVKYNCYQCLVFSKTNQKFWSPYHMFHEIWIIWYAIFVDHYRFKPHLTFFRSRSTFTMPPTHAKTRFLCRWKVESQIVTIFLVQSRRRRRKDISKKKNRDLNPFFPMISSKPVYSTSLIPKIMPLGHPRKIARNH